jgi:hypothetical protein
MSLLDKHSAQLIQVAKPEQHLVRQFADGSSRLCIGGQIYAFKECTICKSIRHSLKDINKPIICENNVMVLFYQNVDKKTDKMIICSNPHCMDGQTVEFIEPCSLSYCKYNK